VKSRAGRVPAAGARLRRARTLLVHWNQGALRFENYRTRVEVTAAPVTFHLLNFFEDWRPPEDLFRALPRLSRRSLRRALRELAEHTLLVREGTPEARQDEQIAKVWRDWPAAARLHFSSKDLRFLHGKRSDQRLRALLRASTPPPREKRYPQAPRLPLPPLPTAASEFPRVLLARRTHRQFSPAALPLEALAQLLGYTWGVTAESPTLLGPLFQKTSPSGGARHPVEVYVLALRVAGLPRGLYYYNGVEHRLERLRRGANRAQAIRYCAGQRFAGNAAALFLMTAVFPRSMWKYRFARAYRVVLLDAGHLCQTFCLTATWLGLAPFCTAALGDSAIEKDLRIDGISESVLYAAGVGLPRPAKTAPQQS